MSSSDPRNSVGAAGAGAAATVAVQMTAQSDASVHSIRGQTTNAGGSVTSIADVGSGSYTTKASGAQSSAVIFLENQSASLLPKPQSQAGLVLVLY